MMIVLDVGFFRLISFEEGWVNSPSDIVGERIKSEALI